MAAWALGMGSPKGNLKPETGTVWNNGDPCLISPRLLIQYPAMPDDIGSPTTAKIEWASGSCNLDQACPLRQTCRGVWNGPVTG